MSIDFESTPDTYGNDFASDGPTAPRSQAYLHPVAMLFNWLFKAVALAVYLPLSLIFGADVSFFFSSKSPRRFSSTSRWRGSPLGASRAPSWARGARRSSAARHASSRRLFLSLVSSRAPQTCLDALFSRTLTGQRKYQQAVIFWAPSDSLSFLCRNSSLSL